MMESSYLTKLKRQLMIITRVGHYKNVTTNVFENHWLLTYTPITRHRHYILYTVDYV